MNGDNQQINFTVADRVLLATINTKLDGLCELKKQSIQNTTAIKYIKWTLGGGSFSGFIIVILHALGIM